MIDKLLPQAIEFEQAVLGALLLETDSIQEASAILKPGAFYKESHGKIYSCIIDLYDNRKSVDILTVTDKLRRSGQLDEVGGPAFLSELVGKVATASHVEYHSLVILEKYLRREIIRVSGEMIQKGYDESIGLEQLMNDLNLAVQGVNEISVEGNNTRGIKDHIKKSLEDLQKREERYTQGGTVGLPTPLDKLTSHTGGWRVGDLIIIAGRPSMGKSAFMVAQAKKAIENNNSPLIFSLEMSGTSLVDRIIIGESGITSNDYRIGKLSQKDWQKIEKVVGPYSASKIYIDDTPYVNIQYIHRVSRLMVRKELCDLVMIDYLQLIRSLDRRPGANREQEVAEISKTCKGIARELNVPVILFAQLNREVEKSEKKRPQLHHLRESGAIEQDADLVILMYRAEKYAIDTYENGEDSRGLGELIVAKYREGAIGTIRFRYNESLTKLYDENEQEELAF